MRRHASQFLSLLVAIAAVIILLTPVSARSPALKPEPLTTSRPASLLQENSTVGQQQLELNQQLLEIPQNQSKPIKVTAGVYINNLINIDQSNETFTTTGYLYSRWKDARLSFDPRKKGLQQLTSYTPQDIWTPKLGLVNAEDFDVVEDQVDISPDGTVQRVRTFEVTLSSKFFLKFFPFDSQKLLILVEPWDFSNDQVVLEPDTIVTGINQESFATLSEWHFKGVKQNVNSILFPPDRSHYSRLTVELQIQRQPAFYVWNIFIPILLFNIVAWSAFWIHPQSAFDSQVTLIISSMLFLITFNFIAQEGLPRVP